ncbi:MAG: hypothetical protein Q9227_007619 [Pyrenula ochraceoflavens]
MRYAVLSALLSLTGVLAAPTPLPQDDSMVDEPGVWLMNKGKTDKTFYFFDNKSNGCGTASPNFNSPDKTLGLKAGEMQFVPLDISFKGRVQAGPSEAPSADDWWNHYRIATWVELQLQANPECDGADGGAHGDVSLQSGCDIPAIVHSTTSNGASNGFSTSCPGLNDPAATITRPDGSKVVADNTNGAATAAIDAVSALAGKVYAGGMTSGVPDVASSNNRLAIDFFDNDDDSNDNE